MENAVTFLGGVIVCVIIYFIYSRIESSKKSKRGGSPKNDKGTRLPK